MDDLLFVCHRIPYPPDKGDKIRAWHILRHLARRHRMHVACFIDDPADWAHVPALRAACADLACFPLHRGRQTARALLGLRPGRPMTLDWFGDPAMRAWVAAKAAATRLAGALAFSSSMAPYVLDLAGIHAVLDMVDVDSEKFAEYARKVAWPKSLVWAREGRTLLAFERAAAMRADRTLFVSRPEWDRFVQLAPECAGRGGWLENGVDLDRFAPGVALPNPYPAGPNIAFTGTMDYWPNIDAVAWFAREVMPLLPGCAFWIVGANPSREVLALAALPGIRVTGRVADTRAYIAHADVVAAPLRVARGIQNKVLEAMAMARPVVASPQAFEGVRAEPGADLLVADGAAGTAAAVRAVLDGRHPALGANARRAMETGYDWAETLRPLDALFAQPDNARVLDGVLP